ncbi:RNA-binding protein 41-like [Spodoptera litura]|uniref:RNA-binding protein 41-like n=1 Tax=Spodoptera litura TaxID=69820 RepID=A0A9J7E9A3_SPOLT|nr:RNA-binding protein 41-like [Spodoptera litura]
MCSESLPKEFEKTTEVLPFPKYGLSSVEEFRKAEQEVHHHEWLKKAGLTSEEIKLYQENEAGLLDQRKKIESGALKDKLEDIYNKINNAHNQNKSHTVTSQTEQPSTSSAPENLIERLQQKPITFYPEGHPMNELKQLEGNLFGQMKNDMMPLTKRRKLLRRLQRKKERLQHDNPFNIAAIPSTSRVDRPGSLWDMREMPRLIPHTITSKDQEANAMGPHFRAMYTVRNNKILRLEPVQREQDEHRALDLVMQNNDAETNLLEGTKMPTDDIRKIDRFKDWTPGTPSKVLFLKNIAPTVSLEQLSLLFNQFLLANGGPVDVRLMTGRMRGQAFVSFQSEDIAIQALDEVHGTILSGRPVIAEFGRNTNSIQDDFR